MSVGEWTSENGRINLNGKPVNLKGASWFGFQTSARAPHGLWGNINSSFFLDFLKDNDFNAIRLPLDLDLMLHDGKHAHVADDPKNTMTSLGLLDYLIKACADRGIVVLLDMHCLDTGGTNQSPVWFNSKFSEQDAIDGWVVMATRSLVQITCLNIFFLISFLSLDTRNSGTCLLLMFSMSLLEVIILYAESFMLLTQSLCE
jgi:endoglucanase